jgi:large subunit ribosomal protein L4
MASLTVYDQSGSEVGKYEIDHAEIAPRISKQLLHDAVVMYQANQRQGSHKTKSRAEVAGTSKKMYRQKGTGNARAGSKRSGVRRGGGHIFARRNRDYSYRMPKKAVRLATQMAIASKVRDGEVVVVDELTFDRPATKQMAGTLAALGLRGETTLIAVDVQDVNAYKSSRNIPGVSISPVADLNALSVLSPRKMLVTKAALDAIKERAAAKAPASE